MRIHTPTARQIRPYAGGRRPGYTVALAASLALGLAACGGSGHAADGDGKQLTIGVKYDQPGLSYKTDSGQLKGFNVDVARYIARKLGVPPSHITWKEVVSGNRETFIQTGQVDLVVETYSITKERMQKVAFGGPFFLAHQRLLVRSNDRSISGPTTLAGHKLCSIAGSTPAQRIKQEYPKVQLQEYSQDAECVSALLNGAIDAMTTDDVILAGYASQHHGKLKVVGPSMSDENYGIGLKKSDTKLKNQVNAAVTQMIKDGTWKKLFRKNIPGSVYPTPRPPTVGKIVGEY